MVNEGAETSVLGFTYVVFAGTTTDMSERARCSRAVSAPNTRRRFLESEEFGVLSSSCHPGIIDSQVNCGRCVLGVMLGPLATESTFQCVHVPKCGANILSG